MTLNDIRIDAINLGYTGDINGIQELAEKVNNTPDQVYELMEKYGISLDSVIREKLFSYIADTYHNGNYNKIYYQWLGL
jgi:hypothetical protein